MKKIVNFLEKAVIGIALSFLLVSGFSYTQGGLFSQKAFAKPADNEWWLFFCIDCYDPCPVHGGMCAKIEKEG